MRIGASRPNREETRTPMGIVLGIDGGPRAGRMLPAADMHRQGMLRAPAFLERCGLHEMPEPPWNAAASIDNFRRPCEFECGLVAGG